jgi:hypothetical protein
MWRWNVHDLICDNWFTDVHDLICDNWFTDFLNLALVSGNNMVFQKNVPVKLLGTRFTDAISCFESAAFQGNLFKRPIVSNLWNQQFFQFLKSLYSEVLYYNTSDLLRPTQVAYMYFKISHSLFRTDTRQRKSTVNYVSSWPTIVCQMLWIMWARKPICMSCRRKWEVGRGRLRLLR